MLCRICSHCGRRYTGTQCNCATVRKLNRERQQRYDRNSRDKEAVAFYHSAEWQRVRRAVWARAYGLDEYVYYTEGRAVHADTVHHIEPRNEAPDKQYDMNNLICVSNATHKLIHDLYRHSKERTQEKLRQAVGVMRPPPSKSFRRGKSTDRGAFPQRKVRFEKSGF